VSKDVIKEPAAGEKVRVGGLVVDLAAMKVTSGGALLDFPDLSVRLFVAILNGGGKPVSAEALEQFVWEGNVVGAEALKQRIKLLRGALAEAGEKGLIETARGKGYQIAQPIVGYREPSVARKALSKGMRYVLISAAAIFILTLAVSLYEDVYTPYRLSETSLHVLPVKASGLVQSADAQFNAVVLEEMVGASGLAVITEGDGNPQGYLLKIELTADGGLVKGRALIVQQEGQRIAGVHTFSFELENTASMRQAARAIAESTATIIRGFPKRIRD